MATQPGLFEKDTTDKKAFLIDANSMVHRAFHALPKEMKNARGQVINAVFGFTSMLIKILKDFNPELLVAAFDTEAPTFRHLKFEEYKANRPETDEDLIPQFDMVKKILEGFNVPVLEKEGFEADDILATLAIRLSSEYEVYIVSGDRDMLQLVNDRVKVVTTRKGVSEVKIYDRQKVFERFGVYPEEIPDFLALKGEPSDNIPGVPGIGEKTAAELIRKYGNLENLYEHIEELKGKRYYKALMELREQVFQARELTRLRTDVEIDLSGIKPFSFDREKVAAVLTEFRFKSLLKRLELPEISEKIGELELSEDGTEVSPEELTATSLAGALDSGRLLLSGEKPAFTSLEPEKVLSIEFETLYLESIKDFYHVLDKQKREAVRGLIEDKRLIDIGLVRWLLDPDLKEYSLDSLAGSREKAIRHLHDILRWSKQSLDRLKEMRLEKVLFEVEEKIALVLAEMEEAGLPVDIEQLEDLGKELDRLIQQEEETIFKLTGYTFNINSPQQLGYVLFEKLKLKKGKKGKTGYSTDQNTLMKLINEHPVVEHVLNYRELTKLKRTYVDAFLEKVDEDGRIRTTFVQTGTATGRISSENPNLQNLPLKGEFADRFRQALRCPEGRAFISADYATIDLRVLAHLSGDEKLIEAFMKGEDIHSRTAREVFGRDAAGDDHEMRRIAKIINFGIIYGVSPEGLARQAGIPVDQARDWIERYFRTYTGVKNYLEKTVTFAYENGYVTTILGRRRYLPGLNSSSPSERNAAERLAMNTPIQGSSADIMKLAMLRLDDMIKKEGLSAQLVLQVHDSLVLECPEREADRVKEIVKHAMEGAIELKVPLSVKIRMGSHLAEV